MRQATRYRFSRRVGKGGMGEVFLAVQQGLGGFEKLVAVKRIFPHLVDDERFVTMFLEEARLAASLNHPNIVEIFDIRRDEKGFYLVMEYLSGETLSYVIRHRPKGEPLPVPIACRIAAAAFAGSPGCLPWPARMRCARGPTVST